jgi:hypothetical protein
MRNPVTKRFKAPALATSASLLVLAQAGLLSAQAAVTPAMVDESAPPGGSVSVDKTVDTPELPPVLDLCLMIDLSGSYSDDLPNINALAPGLFDDVRAGVADSQFCVNSFVDFPISPWGSAATGDYAYQLDQDLTFDKATWTGAVSGLVTRFGGDGPESQYEALFQAATGAGRDVPPGGASTGDIAPGLDPSWRASATKVVAITTDAPFHVPTDSGGTYPGPSRDDTVAALTGAGVKVIAIKAPGSTSQMDDIASATGGSVVTTSNTSAEIADAILEGLGNLPITVTPVPMGCDPLNVVFFPASSTVTSGDTATFTEVIDVPNDPTLEGMSVHCTVDFQDENGNSLGEQEIWISVDDVTPPQSACVAGVNPAGHEPQAGVSSPGQNEDGFYLLIATDNVDADPEIFVTDTGSGTVFGPFADGTNIKYVQAPGGKPGIKSGPGEVDYRIKGTGDFVVYAVDDAGNQSPPATCLVPPPPK